MNGLQLGRVTAKSSWKTKPIWSGEGWLGIVARGQLSVNLKGASFSEGLPTPPFGRSFGEVLPTPSHAPLTGDMAGTPTPKPCKRDINGSRSERSHDDEEPDASDSHVWI